MTISSSSAMRRYLDRSSFTSLSATVFIHLPFRLKPLSRSNLRHDGKYLYHASRNIVEDTDIADPQPVLRSRHAAKALDPALALARRLVAEPLLQGRPYRLAVSFPRAAHIVYGLG